MRNTRRLPSARFAAAAILLAGSPLRAALVAEFEDGTLSDSASVATSRAGYSGRGFVAILSNGGSAVTVDVEADATYDVVVRYASPWDDKPFDLFVDGVRSPATFAEATDWTEATVATLRLAPGAHTIAVRDGWGYYFLDRVRLVVSGGGAAGGISDADAGSFTGLVDPKATAEARGLMRYLSSIYGKSVLAGHQMSYDGPWKSGGNRWAYEIDRIRGWTGKLPATRGYDFMDAINGWGSPVMTYALAWARDSGGILNLCWHWRRASQGGSFNNGPMPSDPARDPEINADLEKLAAALEPFADAQLPVLWRPLHEPPGKWFWWHNGGAGPYVALWRHMYDVLVNKHGLHNLIWVYSASHDGARSNDWYPGNAYVDIIGVDGYNADWQNYWDGLWSMSGGGRKMAAMTENGRIPPWSTRNHWLWTLEWNNEIFDQRSDAEFKDHYGHAATLTIDDLPTRLGKTTWDKMIPSPPVAIRRTDRTTPVNADAVEIYGTDGRLAARLASAEAARVLSGRPVAGLRAGVYFARGGGSVVRFVVAGAR